jgi:hypothetical protein
MALPAQDQAHAAQGPRCGQKERLPLNRDDDYLLLKTNQKTTMKPTTVGAWISAFPFALQTLITANVTKPLDRNCNSAGDAIDKALTWSQTKEGGDFWHGVHHALGGTIGASKSLQAAPRFQAGFQLGMEAREHLDKLSSESPLPVTKDPELVCIKFLEQLPDGYRELALHNHKKWPNSRYMPQNLGQAVSYAQEWARTPEGFDFWSKIRDAIDYGKPFPPLPLSAKTAVADEAPTHKPTHNMHPKYSDQPVAQITAVFGTDVSTMSASDCLNAIKSNNSAAKALTDTGITGPYVDEQVNNLKAANEVLLARLNSFVKAPTA